MKPENKTVEQLRADGWGVVLITPGELEGFKRPDVELVEDILGDRSVDLIYSLKWPKKQIDFT